MPENKCKPIPELTPAQERRFLRSVPQGLHPNACWPWLGNCFRNGYGRFCFNYASYRASRIAYLLHYGCDPSDLLILHSCDNPSCVNPIHIYAGTPDDNMHDKMSRGRHRAGKGPRPASQGSRHGRAKLTEEQVHDIRKRCTRGESDTSLSQRYGVSRGLIWFIRTGKNWSHIKTHGSADTQRL